MDSARDPVSHEEYPSSSVLGAALATLFFPVVSLSSSSTSIDRSGPCVGGPEIGADAYQQDDGSFVFPCAISGTETQRGP